jgi:uroporphyrinogen-III decarboxylase
MDKRERLQRTIAGEPVDRPPVALWRHWPVDDQTPEGLAEFATNVTNWHEFFHSCKFVQFVAKKTNGVGRRTLVLGTPEEIAAGVTDAVARTGGRRLILSTGCVAPLTTPWGNLRALRQAVERITLSGGFRSASGGSRV